MLFDEKSFEYQNYIKYLVIVSSSSVNTRILKTHFKKSRHCLKAAFCQTVIKRYAYYGKSFDQIHILERHLLQKFNIGGKSKKNGRRQLNSSRVRTEILKKIRGH